MARELVVRVVGDASSLEAALGKSAAAATGFVGSLKAKSAEMAAVGASITKHLTLPLAAIGGVGSKMAMDFQASMELIHTQAGLPQKDVAALSAGVLKLAGEVGLAPSTLATGLFHVVSQGVKGTSEQLAVLKTAAEGSAMGQADMEDATNALGAVMFSNLKGLKSTTQAMGEMNAIVGAGDMHFQDLADAMGTKLPSVLATTGVSLKSAGAALAIFGDQNIRGAEAGTMLGSALQYMTAPSGAAAAAMKKVGLGTQQLASDLRSGGILKAMEDIRAHLQGLSKDTQNADLTAMFTKKGGTGVEILLNQMDRLPGKLRDIDKGGEKFAADWAAYTHTAAYKASVMGASMQAAGISIGNILLPFVSKAVNALSSLAAKFQKLPGPVKDLIVGIGLAAAAIGPAISLVGNLGEALTFLAANPIVLVVAAVAAVGAAMAAAVLAPQKLKAALEDLGLSASTSAKIVNDLRDAFGQLEWIVAQVASFVQAHWPEVQAVIVEVANAVIGVIRDNWSTIKAIVTEVISDVKTVIRAGLNLVESLWRTFGSNIETQARNVWNLVKATVQNGLTVIRGIVDLVTGLIHGDWGKAWQGIKEIFTGVWKEIEAVFRYEVATLGNLADAAGKAIVAGVLKPLEKLGQAVYGDLQALGKTIARVADEAYGWALQVGKAVKNGVLDALEGLAGAFESKVQAALGWLHHPHLSDPPYDVARAQVGAQIVRGILDGLDGLGAGFSSKTAAQIHGALDRVTPTIALAARLLGVKATQGVVDGALGVQQSMAAQLRQALDQAMAPALAEAAAAPAIKAASGRLGAATVQGIVNSVVGKQPTLAQQIRISLSQALQQGMQQAQQTVQTFKSSFDSLANSILSAFDTAHANFLAPAQKQLNAMQLQDQINQYQQAVDQAKTTLATDQQALTDAMSGGDPTKIKAAQQQVLSDQQAWQAAVRQQQEFQLGQLAAKQDAADTKTVARMRDTLARQLLELKKGLAKEPDQWDKLGKDVQKILKSFETPLYQSGQKFASQFSDGIKSQLASVEAAAKAMAESVAKYVPRSPAKTGPLAFSSQQMGAKFALEFAQGIAQGFYQGQELASLAGVFSPLGAAPGTSTFGAARSLPGSTAGGVVELHATLPIYLDGRQVAENTYTHLQRKRMRRGPLGLS